MKRREPTRHLIVLGDLVAKASLTELTEDDTAVLYGILIEAAAKLRSKGREQHVLLWRRREKRAFEDAAHN